MRNAWADRLTLPYSKVLKWDPSHSAPSERERGQYSGWMRILMEAWWEVWKGLFLIHLYANLEIVHGMVFGNDYGQEVKHVHPHLPPSLQSPPLASRHPLQSLCCSGSYACFWECLGRAFDWVTLPPKTNPWKHITSPLIRIYWQTTYGVKPDISARDCQGQWGSGRKATKAFQAWTHWLMIGAGNSNAEHTTYNMQHHSLLWKQTAIVSVENTETTDPSVGYVTWPTR